jgi:malonyl CoA-acyl carrier protein transacylase
MEFVKSPMIMVQANAIQKAHTISSEFGIKKSIILNVSAPFHSSLMESAAQTMLQALQNVSISSTIIDVISNFSVKKHTQGTTRDLLVKQVAGIVRWRETMELLVSDYEQNIFIEVGPGQVLSGIAKRMNPTCQTFSLCSPQSIDDFISYQGKKNV